MAFNNTNFEWHTTFPNIPSATDLPYNAQVWKYTTDDDLDEITDHYFDDARDRIRRNDWIAVMADDKNAWFRVTASVPDPLSGSSTVTKFTEVSAFSGQINIP